MKADKACIDVAAGRAPADLVFKNVNVVNVFPRKSSLQTWRWRAA